MNLQPVHVLGECDLAAKARGIRQFVGQVQHVQLLVARLVGQLFVVISLKDQMAGGAGQGALAGSKPVQIHAVVNHHVQQGVAHLARRLDPVAVGPHKGYVNTVKRRLINVYVVYALGVEQCSIQNSHIFLSQGQTRRESAQGDR